MATEYLVEGATGLGAANWVIANGTGGTGFATDAVLYANKGSPIVTLTTDQSAAGNGVSLFEVTPQCSGRFGTGASPCRFDVDGAAPTQLNYNAGGGYFYYHAGGNSSLCTNLNIACKAQFYLVNGTVTNLRFQQGYLGVNANATVTTAYLGGGKSDFDPGTASTTVHVGAGVHNFRRAAATINVYGGTFMYDAGTAEASTGTVTVWEGATLRLVSQRESAATALYVYGVLDLSELKYPVTYTNIYFGSAGRIINDSKNLVGTRNYLGPKVIP